MKKLRLVPIMCILISLIAISIQPSTAVKAIANSQGSIDVKTLITELSGQEVKRLESGKLPYYSTEKILDQYVSGEFTYRVDSSTGQLVEVMSTDPGTQNVQINKNLDKDELQRLAINYIEKCKLNVNLDELSLVIGNKGEVNYFYRWNHGLLGDPSYGKYYVQVGFTKDGQLLNLVNTLPFMNESESAINQGVELPDSMNTFTEVYANDGSYWSSSGGPSSITDYGYCGSPSGSWCSPYSIRYAFTNVNSDAITGTWSPSPNTNTKASAFVPSNYATTTSACYYLNGIKGLCVNQNNYYDSWVSIITNYISGGISTIKLGNKGPSSSTFTAWDETWVYDY